MLSINKKDQKSGRAGLLVVVVNWNTKSLLFRCLKSLQACREAVKFDVVVVDNGSMDGSAEMVESEFSDYHLFRNKENMGFAKANNLAFRTFPQYACYLLLNSDASLTPDAIETLLSFLETRPDIAAVGPALKLPSGRYQFGGAGWGPNWMHAFNTFFLLSNVSRLFRGLFICQERYADAREPVMVDWLAGACLLIRAATFENTGLLDERYFVYGEDADWCWRAREKGWKIAYLPYVSVLHELGASSMSKVGPAWFLNLADVIRIKGGRINYRLFLISGLIGYSIRFTVYALQYAIKKDENSREYRQRNGQLLNTCYKLMFVSNPAGSNRL